MDRKTGLNLQQDFRAFLTASNLAYLIPGEGGGYPPPQANGVPQEPMQQMPMQQAPVQQAPGQQTAQPWQPQMLPPPQQQISPYSGGQYTR